LIMAVAAATLVTTGADASAALRVRWKVARRLGRRGGFGDPLLHGGELGVTVVGRNGLLAFLHEEVTVRGLGLRGHVSSVADVSGDRREDVVDRLTEADQSSITLVDLSPEEGDLGAARVKKVVEVGVFGEECLHLRRVGVEHDVGGVGQRMLVKKILIYF
jgi:hypothetical protein